MARARNIKPSFFTNEILGQLDPIIGMTFVGLWCLADRDGRMEDRPLRIKAELFPYRESLDVNGYLTVLQRNGFIDRYQVDGKGYIEIINFVKHQNPHHTEKSKGYPCKPAPLLDNRDVTVTEPLLNCETKVSERSDSLIPDSLIPDSLNHESGIMKVESPAPTRKAREDSYQSEFDELWKLYPPRKGASKANSLKAYAARRKEGHSADEIKEGVIAYARYIEVSRTEEQFIKQPETFFGPGLHFQSDWTPAKPKAVANGPNPNARIEAGMEAVQRAKAMLFGGENEIE